jgi:hypothetical protein
MSATNDPGKPAPGSSGGKTWMILLVVGLVGTLCAVPAGVAALVVAVFLLKAEPRQPGPAIEQAPVVAPPAPDLPPP